MDKILINNRQRRKEASFENPCGNFSDEFPIGIFENQIHFVKNQNPTKPKKLLNRDEVSAQIKL